jgi:hypothetical protein
VTFRSRDVVALSVLIVFFAGSAFSSQRKPKTSARVAAQPFASFERIDAQLTRIDRNLQKLKSYLNDTAQLQTRRNRSIGFRNLRRSVSLRSLASSSASLRGITRNLELHFERRRQRYGARIFGSLHREAVSMVRSDHQISSATTMSSFRAAQREYSKHLLAFILQFQAISGGYGALECGPGEWACCQPSVRQLGSSSLHGCTWICTRKIRTCRSGCLGPRTPRNAQIIANAARENSQAR